MLFNTNAIGRVLVPADVLCACGEAGNLQDGVVDLQQCNEHTTPNEDPATNRIIQVSVALLVDKDKTRSGGVGKHIANACHSR